MSALPHRSRRPQSCSDREGALFEYRGSGRNNQDNLTSTACRDCHRPRVALIASRMQWPSSDRRDCLIVHNDRATCQQRSWLGRGCTQTQTTSTSKRVQYRTLEDSTNGNVLQHRRSTLSRARLFLSFKAVLMGIDIANAHGGWNVLTRDLVVFVLTMPRHFVVFAVPRWLGALRVPRTRMVPANSVMGSRREECRSRDQRMGYEVHITP